MYSDEEDDDLKKYGNGYEEETDEETDGDSEEDSSTSEGQASPLDKIKKGGFNFANSFGKAAKVIKKIVGLISKLPLPVQAFIYTAIAGVIAYIVINIKTMEASGQTISSVNYTVSNMQEQVEDGIIVQEDGTVIELNEEQKGKIQKAVDFYKENNSYLYFTISNVNDAYNNFVNEYSSSNDTSSELYKSYSTEFGENIIDETSKTQRIVNPNQKLPLFIHLLMTEKYNFNAVEWQWYGHGHDGEVIADNNMIQDKELGLKYPNDGKTKIDTFIELLSPYMLTWHIPLGFHSGFMTKSGSSQQASKFTYSIIQNAYSDIIAHRYDVQKRTTETKYDEYTESVYSSNFDVKVEVNYEYRPIHDGKYILEFKQLFGDGKSGIETDLRMCTDYLQYVGNYDLYIDDNETEAVKSYVTGSLKGKLVTEDELKKIIQQINSNATYVCIKNSEGQIDLNSTFASVTDNGEYQTWEAIDGPGYRETVSIPQFSTDVQKVNLYKYIYTYEITATPSGNPKKDSYGNTLYELYASYKYSDRTVNEPKLNSSREINERLNPDGTLNPMLEELVENRVTISNKYYVSKADAFDVQIENKFNYIRYNESDANNRKNAKSERQNGLEDYEYYINIENKITKENISSYVNSNNNLVYLESTFNATGNVFDGYSDIKNLAPNTLLKIKDEVTLPSNLRENVQGLQKVKSTEDHTINYESKNTYTEQIGRAEEGKGTHYILRIWEDTLTQRSTDTKAYEVETVDEFNAKYNSKLNNTDIEAETEKYKELIRQDEANYSDYKVLAVQSLLNNIYLINSNSNIYNKYLIKQSPQGKTMGYNLSYIEMALDEVKRLFKQTEKENGTIPYFYGVSLGFTNILKENSTRKINATSRRFIWPIPQFEYVSYIYGFSTAYSGGTYANPGSYGLHTGIDLSIGDVEVLAAADGIVVACENTIPNDTYIENSYGNYVLIEHENGYATLYSHLASDVKVTLGANVTQGDVIGITNTTGSSSGKHLHYEIRQCADPNIKFADSGETNAFTYYGEKIDPLEFYVVEPANGNTIPYEELLLNPALGEQITMQNPYKFVGYVGMGIADEEFLGMLHSWEGGVSEENVKVENGIRYYRIHDDGYTHATVGRGVDINASGFKDRFIAAGYPTEIGGWVPADFVDALEEEELLGKEESLRSILDGIELTDYQWQAMISRAYNCGAAGATYSRPRNDPAGLTFIEAYNKYWVGNETTEIDFEHPFFVNYMKYPETSEGKISLGLQRRRRAEWILFVTGTVANNGDVRTGLY